MILDGIEGFPPTDKANRSGKFGMQDKHYQI
jgi:hypothetical protein